MNKQMKRVIMGTNVVACCLFLQACRTVAPKTGMEGTEGEMGLVDVQPGDSLTPIAVTPVTQSTPDAPTRVTAVQRLPTVQSSTPYTIQSGDTITAVAYKYGLRWQDVVAMNPEVTPTRLRIGQVIQLPGAVDLSTPRVVPTVKPKAPVKPAVVVPPKSVKPAEPTGGQDTVYTVKAGDSLSVIAYRHGIKTAALREANNIKGDKILVGQKLKVPGATKKVSAPATTTKPAVTPPKPVTPAQVVAPPKVAPVVEPALKVDDIKTPVAPVKNVEAPQVETPAPVDAGDQYETHKVTEDDKDIYTVAIRWSVPPSELKALNNLDSNELKPGMVLRIPIKKDTGL